MEKCEISGFGTHLKVLDIKKSREFYESLGFKPVFAYGDEEWRTSLPQGLPSVPEKYRGIVFALGETGIAKLEIAEGHIGVKNKEVFKKQVENEKISAMVNVKSLIPLFTNPLVNIAFPVRHYYWGTIESAFRDPDGYVLVFIAPYSEEELAAVKEFKEVEIIKPR